MPINNKPKLRPKTVDYIFLRYAHVGLPYVAHLQTSALITHIYKSLQCRRGRVLAQLAPAHARPVLRSHQWNSSTIFGLEAQEC
jgi:hypothetical protein